MNWFFQSTTHDLPSEQDCQWSAALINVNGRKEIAVPCRDYFYGLDAATGQLLWSYDPLTQQATGTNPNKYPLIGTNMGDQANMTLPYAGYPSGVASWNTTVNENAPAFDGKKTVFYFGNENAFGGGSCTAGQPSTKMPPPPVGPFQAKNCAPHTANFAPASATIVAIDASTGQIEWKNTLSGMSYRGGITYTGGIVFGCTSDGFCRGWDAANGNLVWSKYMGVAMSYTPTFGETADSKVMAYLPVGGGLIWGQTPGFLAAFSFAAPPATVTTTTATSIVVSSIPGPSTGVDPTLLYGVSALAVIFIIATGVLAVRRRKPAS